MQTQNGTPAIPAFLLIPSDNPVPTQPTPPANSNGSREGSWSNTGKFASLRYTWYNEPFTRPKKDSNHPGGGDYLLLPPHGSNPRKEQGWWQEIEYVRFDTIADLKPQFRDAAPTAQKPRGDFIEFPLLTNWGVARRDDPIAALSLALYKRYSNRSRGGYPWLLTKRRYLFLVAYAKPELQAEQKAPLILELPGDRKDHGMVVNAVKSVGYTLATMPDERITVESHPNYGQPKYGCICNPASQPIITVRKQTGTKPEDVRYAVEIATPSKADWVALKNWGLLEHIKPMLNVVNRPSMEYIANVLRATVEPEVIQEFIPEFAGDILGTNEALGMPRRAVTPVSGPAPAIPESRQNTPAPSAAMTPPPTLVQPTSTPVNGNGTNGSNSHSNGHSNGNGSSDCAPKAVATPTPAPAPAAPAPVVPTPVLPVAPTPAPAAPAPSPVAAVSPVEIVISRVTKINLPTANREEFSSLITSMNSDPTMVQAFVEIGNSPQKAQAFLRLAAIKGMFERWLPYCAFN